jgi:GrpB-like predicted nucleotidyltransferase (UPF0157 family)
MIASKIFKRKVILSPYNIDWPVQFSAEAKQLQILLGENCVAIYHIGSTAVPTMLAKPTIDILIVVKDLVSIDKLNPLFKKRQYRCLGEYGILGRRFYWRGNTTHHTFHLHVFVQQDPQIARHLAFRDYLIKHHDSVLGYSNIKRYLAEQFYQDMPAYIEGKDPVVRMIDYQTGHATAEQQSALDTIVLEKYNAKWPKFAAAEISAIIHTVRLPYEAIEHLGSTAVKSLAAKPIIDIFIALTSLTEVNQWIKPLESLGYLYWHDNPDKSHHRFFKGMPPYGLKRTHHVHIMKQGTEFQRRVDFRNKLRQNKQLAQRYEKLKYELAQHYSEDREGYTVAKEQFIQQSLFKREP